MGIYDYGGKPNKLTINQALQYAQQAGFSGSALITAVAIAMSESGLDANSINTTTSGVGVDRGIIKLNSVYHSEYPDSCAFDPACSFRAMYSISQGGTNFCQWCTYNANCAHPCNSNGPYKSNLATVQQAAQGLSPTASSGSSTSLFSGALGQIKTWGEYAGVFILALFFILAGFYLLNEDKVNSAIKGGVDAAIKLSL